MGKVVAPGVKERALFHLRDRVIAKFDLVK